ncbi:protein translocase subunit SecF [Actinokineospora auranticolor]|uniref:Protein-export membrane protein SecF n=1 Tax=Actinokineospora auranticolor TaxID=155976 RepID=A0A2S6GQ99_9PSEU|nr:protein translocase subunit SecF [Actinokineospora auranticolor]PPK67389.1 preprotein translocase subunit SecF [Actinokineospora auranticolor]
MTSNENPAPVPATLSATGDVAVGGKHSVFDRLYTGTGAFDIVGKRKRWYLIFGALMLVCIASMVFRGFNLGIDFEGGTKVSMPSVSASGEISTEEVKRVFVETLNKEQPTVQRVGTGAGASIQIKSEALKVPEVAQLKQALFDEFKPVSQDGTAGPAQISDSAVSGTWGGEISRQALWALLAFLVLVTIFLAFYFEKWMAVAALAALIHDVVITMGVYSIVGFEVTPATVIGLLTILGFSLYDTVVVFDKVKENTRGLLGLTRRTYGEAANLALNQTLMRSINTSLFALLPVLGLLIVGVGLLGVGTLQDLALVQLTGMLAGALSSIYLATPILVDLKMTEPKFRQQADRVRLRRANQAARRAEATDAELGEEGALEAELRREKAYATASSVPARTPKASDARRKAGKPVPKPTGKPTGKKRH